MKNKIKRVKELQRQYHEMREKMAEKVVPSKKNKYDRKREKRFILKW